MFFLHDFFACVELVGRLAPQTSLFWFWIFSFWQHELVCHLGPLGLQALVPGCEVKGAWARSGSAECELQVWMNLGSGSIPLFSPHCAPKTRSGGECAWIWPCQLVGRPRVEGDYQNPVLFQQAFIHIRFCAVPIRDDTVAFFVCILAALSM